MHSSSPRNRHENSSLSNDPELGMVHIHPIVDKPPSIQPSDGLEEPDSGISSTEPLLDTSTSIQYYQPLPRRVKPTVFRALTVSTLLGIGTAKVVQAWKGSSVTVTWVDWVGGTLFTAIWYCVSLFEHLDPPVAAWFFHQDISLDLFHFSVLIPLIVIASFPALFMFVLLGLVSLYICVPVLEILDRGGWLSILCYPWITLTLLVVPAILLMMFGIYYYIKKILLRHFGDTIHDRLGSNVYCRRAIQRVHALTEGYLARYDEHHLIYTLFCIITYFCVAPFTMSILQIDKMIKSFGPTGAQVQDSWSRRG